MLEPQDITLHIGGQQVKFGGWSSVSVTRSLQNIASSFSFVYSDRWEPTGEAFPITAGDACEVRLNDKLVLKGYVDECQISYSATSQELSASGRSKAGDLVDCSVVHPTGKWNNYDVLKIATAICEPFGIKVTVADGVDIGKPIKEFTIQECETAFESLDRVTKQVGVLLMSQNDGNLVITQSSKASSGGAIAVGINILRGQMSESWQHRHSIYVVKTHLKEDDRTNGVTAVAATDSAVDEEVKAKRYRPLSIIAEATTTLENITKRANWEANVRAARSRKYKLTVPGWTYDGKNLWAPNSLVSVYDNKLDINEDLLIVTTKYERDNDKGIVTELELMDKNAFSKTPIIAKPKNSKDRRSTSTHHKPGIFPKGSR